MDADLIHAYVRFGLGRRGNEPLAADSRSWLDAQLDCVDPLLANPTPSSALAYDAINKEDADHRARTILPPHYIGDLFRQERGAAFRQAVVTDLPFRERLVLFWANHFTVSGRAGGRVLALLGAYVQEAIRPHVTGKFEDMVRAVMHHPAMLIYLGNDGSVGPDSPFGQRRHGGLNENLARECMELHTVGLQAGYTQQDVTSFARILTGWSVPHDSSASGFMFYADHHEPGSNIVMGERFPDGQEGGEAALLFLARHPATYRHIASQMVRHFVADDPSEADVAAIANVLHDSAGDLKAATRAITRLPSAWRPLAKLRSPVEYAVAVYRALDLPDPDGKAGAGFCTDLGQDFWGAPLPNGWSDMAADWTGGEALVRRADWSWRMAGKRPELAPDMVADLTLGPLLSDATRTRVVRAASRQDGVALLLASPEFMRR